MMTKKEKLANVLYILTLISAIAAAMAWFPYFSAASKWSSIEPSGKGFESIEFDGRTPWGAVRNGTSPDMPGVKCSVEPGHIALPLRPWASMETSTVKLTIANNSHNILKIVRGGKESFAIMSLPGEKARKPYPTRKHGKILEIEPGKIYTEKIAISAVLDGNSKYIWARAFDTPAACPIEGNFDRMSVIFRIGFIGGSIKTAPLAIFNGEVAGEKGAILHD